MPYNLPCVTAEFSLSFDLLTTRHILNQFGYTISECWASQQSSFSLPLPLPPPPRNWNGRSSPYRGACSTTGNQDAKKPGAKVKRDKFAKLFQIFIKMLLQVCQGGGGHRRFWGSRHYHVRDEVWQGDRNGGQVCLQGKENGPLWTLIQDYL